MVMQVPEESQQPMDELSALAQSIIKDQRRIAAMQNPSSAAVATEMSGTLLAYDRDLASYLARFEASVIANFQAAFSMIQDLQEGGAAASDDGGTQFEPEDAAKFRDFISGARVLVAATAEAPGTAEQVKQQMLRMVQVADELLALIEENTLLDDGEDEGDAEEAGAAGAGQ